MHLLAYARKTTLALAATILIVVQPVFAQAPVAPPAPPVDPNAVAATVNGQPIKEVAVQRGLERVPPAKRAEARPELLNFLIDNLLIDQYLQQAKVAVEDKEVEERIGKMKAELAKQKQDFAKLLAELKLTEAELRQHIAADVRWEKYVTAQSTDEALMALFEANKIMFNGEKCRAKHILLTPPANTGQAAEETEKILLGYKQQIEAEVAQKMAKLPPETTAAMRTQAEAAAREEAFGKIAKEKSACPSKAQSGDVGWFGRTGYMVEPFARTAFSMKPGTMSNVVKTQFGHHLILVTARQVGKPIEYTAVKDEVREMFAERLHEQLAATLRQRAKIELVVPTKTK